MHPHGGVDEVVLLRQRHRRPAGCQVGPYVQHGDHPRLPRPDDDRLPVVVELGEVQVGVGVNQACRERLHLDHR